MPISFVLDCWRLFLKGDIAISWAALERVGYRILTVLTYFSRLTEFWPATMLLFYFLMLDVFLILTYGLGWIST